MIPEYYKDKFKCPHCETVATQTWFTIHSANESIMSLLSHVYLDYRSQIEDFYQKKIVQYLTEVQSQLPQNIIKFIPSGFAVATCTNCDDITLWVNKDMVYPKMIYTPLPNQDLNEDIKAIYHEASQILKDSPKGASALLRLALQKLLKQVGKSGKNINNDIKELVAEGLSPKIQKALDILRVVGNNAVHPGQIDLEDNKDTAYKLFEILNFIADELITKPKELDSLYANIIPADTQEHIKQRDSQNK